MASSEFVGDIQEGFTNTASASSQAQAQQQHGCWPSGLEVLWKEVPGSFRDLISLDIIPEAALTRGYFTVGELLTLKRQLSERHNMLHPNAQFHVSSPPKKSPTMSQRKSSKRPRIKLEHAQPVHNNEPMTYKMDGTENVGNAVKEAMHVLDDYSQHEMNHYSHNNSINSGGTFGMLEFHSNPPVAAAGSPASSMLSLLNLNSLAAGNIEAASRGNSGSPGAAFVLGSPPLAALHSMTEMKSAMLQHYNNPHSGSQSHKNSSMQSHQIQNPHSPQNSSSSASGTPHGIENILSRPSPALGAAMVASAASAAAGLARLPPGMGMSMSHMANSAWMGAIGKQLELARPALYWPGLQGLVGSQNLWRERVNHSVGSSNSDKDGKKKHTRPTFSGQQIFALEKTFEGTKYLAGPERAKLAYALGMTESQVKVWFQNRRTKWRKKHAAEMATAKRKQEEAEGLIESSDHEDEDCDDDLIEDHHHHHMSKKSKYHHENSTDHH